MNDYENYKTYKLSNPVGVVVDMKYNRVQFFRPHGSEIHPYLDGKLVYSEEYVKLLEQQIRELQQRVSDYGWAESERNLHNYQHNNEGWK